jgi:hypothetical protein
MFSKRHTQAGGLEGAETLVILARGIAEQGQLSDITFSPKIIKWDRDQA